MGNGLKILFAIIGFVALAVAEQVIGWLVSNFLNGQIKSDSYLSIALSTLEHYQLLSLGIAVGGAGALTIGYWEKIQNVFENTKDDVIALLRTFSTSMYKERKISTGVVRILSNQKSADVSVDKEIDPYSMKTEYEPKDAVIATDLIRGKISFIRRENSNESNEILVSYSIWGRTLFSREFSRQRKLIRFSRAKKQSNAS